LNVTAEDDGTPVLGLLACDSGTVRVAPDSRIEVTGLRRLGLRLRLDGEELSFAYATEPDRSDPDWTPIGPSFDATTLSDEYAAKVVAGEPEAWGFTGAFVGLWVQDLGAEGGFADYDRASYRTSG
jgi:xylan 1,4-beta-xylosidase